MVVASGLDRGEWRSVVTCGGLWLGKDVAWQRLVDKETRCENIARVDGSTMLY